MGRNLHQVQFAKEIVSVVILFLITDLVQYFIKKIKSLIYQPVLEFTGGECILFRKKQMNGNMP